MTADARRRVRRGLQRASLAVLIVSLLILALDRAFPPPLAVKASSVVRDAHGVTLRAFPVDDGRWRLQADLDRLDPAFVQALIAIEDKRFHAHAGVDAAAVARAAASWARSGRIVSGASTITMQTARLLEPRPRTLGAKAIEMLRAFQLEARLSKREILELYLTLTPYGGNLEGVRAASWAYFGREPQSLAPEEIALLIALPQAPEARRPDRRPDVALAARARILNRLGELGLIDAARAQEALTTPAPLRRAFPTKAWHASETVRALGGQTADVRSTLDAGLQAELEALIARHAAASGREAQAAVIVVEIASRKVRAAVGSAGRDRPGGWLDLTDRPRSPGSTLKPFIYGLAFDDGLAAPGTRLDDLPKRFASYQPENFDLTFRGEVTLAEALQHSLNVPAVETLDAVGPERFAAALTFAGVAPRRIDAAREGAGLALALGGLGVTMRELAVLYAALGDDGRAKPLVWLEDADASTPEAAFQLLTPASARSLRDILKRAPTPAGRMPAGLTAGAPEIAFKTGTSYGFRDAWAAGVSSDYAVVVWSGRADGAPRPDSTGRSDALPLLFEAFDRIATRLDAPRGPRERRGFDERRTPGSMSRFDSVAAPKILFPPDGAELWSPAFGDDARGFVLAAEASREAAWFVDGEPVGRDALGAAVWRPAGPGFYTIQAVDPQGRSARARVRVVDHAF